MVEPTVSTNKADYAPGETATIKAKGLAPGSKIEFAIADTLKDLSPVKGSLLAIVTGIASFSISKQNSLLA